MNQKHNGLRPLTRADRILVWISIIILTVAAVILLAHLGSMQ